MKSIAAMIALGFFSLDAAMAGPTWQSSVRARSNSYGCSVTVNGTNSQYHFSGRYLCDDLWENMADSNVTLIQASCKGGVGDSPSTATFSPPPPSSAFQTLILSALEQTLDGLVPTGPPTQMNCPTV